MTARYIQMEANLPVCLHFAIAMRLKPRAPCKDGGTSLPCGLVRCGNFQCNFQSEYFVY